MQSRTAQRQDAPNHQLVPATKDPAEIYDNGVIRLEDLPKVRRPLFFIPVKIGLLLLSAVCMCGGIASIVWGANVERNQGGILPGMREIPFELSTAAVFIGSFSASVSLALIGIASRNWYPSLLTFGLFVGWALCGDVAVKSLASPAKLDTEYRVHRWARMAPSAHVLIYKTYQCCGYDNSSTCDMSAIREILESGYEVSSAKSQLQKRAVPAEPSLEAPEALHTPSTSEDVPATPAETLPTTTSFRLQRRTAAPLIHGTETIPQNGPGVPLPTETHVSVSPSPLPTTDLTAPMELLTANLVVCKPKIDPLIDGELTTLQSYYVLGAILNGAQLGFLTAFWAMLGKWKSARGLGRR